MIFKIVSSFTLLCFTQAQAFIITLSSDDFGVTPIMSTVTSFNFQMEIDAPFQAGMTYNNPTISLFEYSIGGSLAPGTPSGFPGFSLIRSMNGTEFYAQGSSLNFSISSSANLSDGLQISELSGSGPVLILNAHEFNTGRYHPSLFELNLDGTGQVQNSNNAGPSAINPSSGELVNVDFGEEYITNLTSTASTTTIAVIPEPSTASFLLLGITMLRRKRSSS